MQHPENITILQQFLGILEQLGILYAVSGSIASSIYGQVRFTQDADIAVEPFGEKGEEFFQIVSRTYYINKQT